MGRTTGVGEVAVDRLDHPNVVIDLTKRHPDGLLARVRKFDRRR
jgi:hypothetical protein